jgi:3-phosphoshikimate 1-carboxyvinyltransferase
MPLVSILPGPRTVLLEGRETLADRSNRESVESMRNAGLDLEGTGSEQTVPIRCYPGQSPTESPIPVACSSTSQLLSGWLLALAASNGGELRRTTQLVSAPYVEMTERVLEEAGVTVDHPAEDRYRVGPTKNSSFDYRVPGDYSSAAFLLVGGLLTDGEVRVQGLRRDDPQADKRIVEILRDLGAQISWEDKSEEGWQLLRLQGPFDPPGFDVNASDCPDLAPILAVLGVLSEGESHIRNVEHLRNKESNRLTGTAEELRKAGYQVRTTRDSLHLGSLRDDYDSKGTVPLDSREDHRLAMAFSVLGLVRGEITVTGAECVSKSYPDFYEHFRSLGASFTKK